MKLKIGILALSLNSLVYAGNNCYILENPESKAACLAQAGVNDEKQEQLNANLNAAILQQMNQAPINNGYTTSQGKYDNLPTNTVKVNKNPYQQEINNQIYEGVLIENDR